MKNLNTAWCLLTFMALSFHLPLSAQQSGSLFTIDPTLDPNGTFIVFSYDGDLWQCDLSGGRAIRLTAMDGNETRPSISPDGKWLAFSGTQNGNKDVFIMPMEGGEIQQLTYHESFDDVDAWSWDSKTIYFTSGRFNRYSGYTVGLDGGTPKRLFGHYFNTVHNVVEHPKTGEIFFNETWESKNFAHRKRYKGDYNPDIKSYNKNTGTFTQHTAYRGKDFGATIDGEGNIYFMSDEANGEYNLYTFSDGEKKQLTNFESAIYWPKVSANGKKIVFRKDYQIFVYDVASGNTAQVVPQLLKNPRLNKLENFTVSGKVASFDVSPDNKKLAFSSRGALFISDIKGKFIKQIPLDPKEAVGEVHWLKDNKTLLFSMSEKGYYNWCTIAADGSAPLKKLSHDSQNNRALAFDSDREKAVYLSGKHELRLMDLKEFTSETIVRDEFWALNSTQPYFSPDDAYVVYAAFRDFEQDIFVYHLPTKKSSNLSHTMVTETDPFWSPDGKAIYFSTDRHNPNYPYGPKNPRIYKMMLDSYEAPFRSEKVMELFEEEKEEKEVDDDAEKKDDAEEEAEKIKVNINPNDLMERIQRIGPFVGRQGNPYVIQKGEKSMILYLSNHDEGKYNLWKTTIEPFEDTKTEKISSKNVYGYSIREADGNHYILTGGSLYTLDAAGGSMEEISLSHTFRKKLSNEFEQIFYEAWAGVEENFYDENFHGEDWQALRDHYASLLPAIGNRAELRLVFNDMLGELNTSHFGFYTNGKEEKTYYGFRSTATGILFEEDRPFVVKRIVKQSPADVRDKDIRSGDILIAINGQAVDPSKNREMYFSAPSMEKEISLTFKRGETKIEKHVHTISTGVLRNLIYDEWQDANQHYVDEKGGKRIAYIHMKNMGGGELNSFIEDMVGQGAYREALILDLRFNTGGNVHDDVLRMLRRKSYLQWKYREGKLTPQSNFSPSDKPIVLLINEQSLSDAEMTATGFKELGLGTVIGTETYRWIIFTSGKGLVDGSFYRLPSWGCYTLDGKNIEKEGVTPDIRVEKNFKDRLDGNHPQLDKAIELLLEAIDK